jgi:hypothetical protein
MDPDSVRCNYSQSRSRTTYDSCDLVLRTSKSRPLACMSIPGSYLSTITAPVNLQSESISLFVVSTVINELQGAACRKHDVENDREECYSNDHIKKVRTTSFVMRFFP